MLLLTNLTPTLCEAATKVWSESAAWGAVGAVDSGVVIRVKDNREAAKAEIESHREVWHRQTRRDHRGQPPGEGRRIVLRLPEYDAHTEIQLAFDLAPDTCENIWNRLPISLDIVLYVDPPPRLQLNYFHDRGSIPFGTPRPEIGNLVGSSVGDFSRFAEACWRLGYEGWKTLVVERAV